MISLNVAGLSVIVLYFMKVRLTVEVGASQELDIMGPTPRCEAGVTHAGVAGLAEVSRLLGRTNILFVIGLSSPLSNLGL